MQDTHLSDLKFNELNLHPKLLKGVEDAGFEYCTPIQALALPLALNNEDVAGQAQTGTGKTAAFLLATFQRLILDDEREAAQYTESAKAAEAEAKVESAEKPDADTEKAASKETSAETESETSQASSWLI